MALEAGPAGEFPLAATEVAAIRRVDRNQWSTSRELRPPFIFALKQIASGGLIPRRDEPGGSQSL
jgi:hypothetical protein